MDEQNKENKVDSNLVPIPDSSIFADKKEIQFPSTILSQDKVEERICFLPGEKKLSILICSINSRVSKLMKLLECLRPQLTADVEILIEKDNGQLSIGAKRNRLLQKASGRFLSFIDDDDAVSDNYISFILKAIETNPDCCGIEGEITFDGKNPKKFIHSLRYNAWFEDQHAYYRSPNHLNPVKRELALRVGFPNIDAGEDRDYSERLRPLLKTEAYIEGIIYHYLYCTNKKIRICQKKRGPEQKVQQTLMEKLKEKQQQQNAYQPKYYGKGKKFGGIR